MKLLAYSHSQAMRNPTSLQEEYLLEGASLIAGLNGAADNHSMLRRPVR